MELIFLLALVGAPLLLIVAASSIQNGHIAQNRRDTDAVWSVLYIREPRCPDCRGPVEVATYSRPIMCMIECERCTSRGIKGREGRWQDHGYLKALEAAGMTPEEIKPRRTRAQERFAAVLETRLAAAKERAGVIGGGHDQ